MEALFASGAGHATCILRSNGEWKDPELHGPAVRIRLRSAQDLLFLN